MSSVVGSTHLQLERTRMVIAILSTRRIVNDFKKDFFMIVLGIKDEISELFFYSPAGYKDTTGGMFWTSTDVKADTSS